MPYQLSPAADDDAFAIVSQAAKVSQKPGRALDSELNDLLERIGDNPGIGAKKPHVTPHPYRLDSPEARPARRVAFRLSRVDLEGNVWFPFSWLACTNAPRLRHHRGKDNGLFSAWNRNILRRLRAS